MRLLRRLLPAAFTIGAVVGSGLAGTLLAAPAASAADCDVAVVVDFSGLPSGPGTTRYGCAAQPSTGLDALDQAGFTPAVGATDQGNVVCDIDGAPGTNCADGGLWAYWYLAPGSDNWQELAPGSAESRTPERGSAEGWSYQAHPDTPASPPAAGGPGTSDPTTPPDDPTPPVEQPTTDPGPSGSAGTPPDQTASGGGDTGVGNIPSGPRPDGDPAAPPPPPPGLGGPGGGGAGPSTPSEAGDSAGSSSPTESEAATTPTGGLTSSGVLGIGAGSRGAHGLSGPVAVASFDTEAPPAASPWTLIACGAVLVAGSIGLAYLRHRRRGADTGGRHA